MNGTGLLIWTTEEGGLFKVEKCTDERYEDVKKNRRVQVDVAYDGPPRYATPFFIAFARVEDNFDFGLERSRDDLVAA